MEQNSSISKGCRRRSRTSKCIRITLLVVWLLGTLAVLPVVNGARRTKPPLIEDAPAGKPRRQTECRFGKQTYELEETWHPDLGSPFGVMYCIRCTCVAVQKKRRVAGRTLCKNIKNECPKPNCDEPVLLPGRCCKVCPEDSQYVGPLKEDVSFGKDYDDEDKNAKDFAALIISQTANQSGVVATARFSFQKRHLYYSLVWSPSAQPGITWQPRVLQILTEDSTILEEQELGPSDLLNKTGKHCGSWRKVPRIYRQLLREEKLWIALVDDKEEGEALTGRISRYRALSSEILSALLVPTTTGPNVDTTGVGGTAAVSLSSSSKSIHITVVTAGILDKSGDDSPLIVRLETSETGMQAPKLIEELITVQKPQEINVVEIRTVLESEEVHRLVRGQLMLTVYSKRNPELRLVGQIGPRIACDIFDTLLTSTESLDEVLPKTSAIGFAWLYIDSVGAIQWHLQLSYLSSPVLALTIQTAPAKKGPVIIKDLTSNYLDGWANGTIPRLSPKDLEMLYEGELYINVATSQFESEIRGRLAPRPASQAQANLHVGPVLMQPIHWSTSSNASSSLSTTSSTSSSSLSLTNSYGLSWVSIDQNCSLHYDFNLPVPKSGSASRRGSPSNAGLQQPSLMTLELIDLPAQLQGHHTLMAGLGSPGPAGITFMAGTEAIFGSAGVVFPPNTRLLEEFSGNQAENSVSDLTLLTLARLNANYASLKLTETSPYGGASRLTLEGRILDARVPASCLPTYARSDGDGEPALGPGYVHDEHEDNEIAPSLRCVYETRFYDDGAQWIGEHGHCLMCSCRRGRVVCDAIVCPKLECGLAPPAHPAGECCPVCSNTTTSITDTGTATGQHNSGSVSRANSMSKNGASHKKNEEQDRLGCYVEGDQKFHPVDSRWHPYIPPFGFSTCVVCVCNASTLKVECSKTTCPPLSCPDSEASRPDPMACCKACPEPKVLSQITNSSLSATQGEEAKIQSQADILHGGGCLFKGDVYENGKEFHPRVQPWGEMRCVNCNCKDGKVKCKRKKCPKNRCTSKSSAASNMSSSDNCCPACGEEAPASSSASTSRGTKIPTTRDTKPKRPHEKGGGAGGGGNPRSPTTTNGSSNGNRTRGSKIIDKKN